MTASASDGRDADALVGERLRAVRRARRLTLADVERASDGEFRTSVLGAYERGERGVAVARLLRLAAMYGVPPCELLPDAAPDEPGQRAASQRYPADAVL